MTRLQLPVLYREFLFRLVDLEVLSAQGDIGKLLGQFAALLAFVSSVFGLGGLFTDPRRMPPEVFLGICWNMAHFLFATTMLVVGLFAVLSWDSMFPDRRDVMVLAQLPVRPRTLFLAKVAALATALGTTVAALNVFSGLTWPAILSHLNSGVAGLARAYAAYWITAVAAGTFLFCAVLGVLGLATQLPRRQFLAVSAFLQMAAFGLFVGVYFLEPKLASPAALGAAKNQTLLTWLPSYWFFGLFHWLNGSLPAHPAMAPLAQRALAGLAIAVIGAGTAFLLSYLRTMRKIVEEPDIVPGSRRAGWSPAFGIPVVTAIVQFSVRSLLRSRQHRVILAFYLGVAFAIVTMFAETPLARGQLGYQVNVPMLASSMLMLCFWMAGTRVVFSMPLDLRANWIFRITAVRKAAEYLTATRRALVVLSVAPALVGSAVAFFSIWPWRPAAGHLVVLALLSMILADLGLHGFRKIPFTCSYPPGKSQAHMVFLSGFGLLLLANWAAEIERRALGDLKSYAGLLAVLGIAWTAARWWTSAAAGEEQIRVVQFEDEPVAVILPLGLTRDGVPAGRAGIPRPSGESGFRRSPDLG